MDATETATRSPRSYTRVSLNTVPRPDATPYLMFGDLVEEIVKPAVSNDALEVALYESGCLHNGGHNCTAVCLDPKLLFENVTIGDGRNGSSVSRTLLPVTVPYNLYNCMYYPYISNLLVDDAATSDERDKAHALADKFGITAGASDDVISGIFEAAAGCWTQFCAQNDCAWEASGVPPAQSGPGMLILDQSSNLTAISYFPRWDALSPNASTKISADIGGIGVSIAFVIQLSILLIAGLYLVAVKLLKTQKDRKKSEPNTYPKFSNTTAAFQQRRVATMVSAMADFQKAQCYFFIPLNLAIIAALRISPQFLSSKNLGQLSNNMAYTQGAIRGSVTFTTFNLITLRIHGHRSIYLCILSCWVAVLGLIAWAFVLDQKRTDMLDLQLASRTDNWVTACGVISPASYVGRLEAQWKRMFDGNANVIVVWLIIVPQCFLEFQFLGEAIWPEQAKRVLARIAKVLRCGPRTLLLGYGSFLQFCAVSWMAAAIWNYEKAMRPNLPAIENKLTLGQLMALAVWIPTFIDGAHALCRNLEQANSHRFATPFEVVMKNRIANPEEDPAGVYLIQHSPTQTKSSDAPLQFYNQISSQVTFEEDVANARHRDDETIR